ncbi:hypothetical protein AVEN_174542-1 [Araneus ventricosus]|uniref:Zinc finger BED domain-containing protein 5 n=1 Tax=Araneus ventricosus TaxID=182803 RepID=A0A4Y2GVY2_ARAVE|nr:hypothetical protein AVEN_174542-1 [Araneus ventricosus]
MDKWLKIGTLKRSASRTEIRTTDLAAMEITVDQQDDNYEVQRPTDWSVQLKNTMDFVKKKKTQNVSEPPKKRKYSNEYLKYGFSVTGDEDSPKSPCVVCGEILSSFEYHPFTLSSKFYESEWLQQLAYLSDIFSEINKLNLEFQNHSITIFKVTDKI